MPDYNNINKMINNSKNKSSFLDYLIFNKKRIIKIIIYLFILLCLIKPDIPAKIIRHFVEPFVVQFQKINKSNE